MLLRFEKKEDIKGIHSVHVESFETDQEAKLVDDLRLGDLDLISLVAEENQKIIGHLLFSPVFLDSNIKIKMMGLAPLAILPTYQNRGIGTLLVRKGLDVCVQKKIQSIVVLGDPKFYSRFGFESSVNYSIRSDFNVNPEVFQIKELEKGIFQGFAGIVKYHDRFNQL